MKKIFLSLLATVVMTSFAFASNGKGKKAKSKKKGKVVCCDKSKCTTATTCDKTTCTYPVSGCGSK